MSGLLLSLPVPFRTVGLEGFPALLIIEQVNRCDFISPGQPHSFHSHIRSQNDGFNARREVVVNQC
jgi:hypothetical protein